MGKWATYRKRGTATAAPTLIPAPPAPVLLVVDDLIQQTSGVLDDTDGLIRLWGAPALEGPYEMLDEKPWQAVFNWDPANYEAHIAYRVTEVGNGVLYLGESPPSNATEF